MAFFNEFAHLRVKECDEQGGDVRTVNISIGHDNNAFITELGKMKVWSGAAAQSLNEVLNFLIGADFIGSRAYDIEDFSS